MISTKNKIPEEYRKVMEPVLAHVNLGREMGLYPDYLFGAQDGGMAQAGICQYGRPAIVDSEVIMLTSNNYLGLASHHKIKNAMKRAIDTYGSATCGSRRHNGTTPLHKELEERLADFMNTEDAVIYSAGFMANLGTLSALGGNDSIIITDQLNHMSIVDGYKLSGSQIKIFAHNDMEKLEYILENSPADKRKLIVVDGVFSMDGDIAPLGTITRLAEKSDAMVMVDEAHGVGVFGKELRGISEHLGLEEQVHIRMGTFSKSLASVGGFIAAQKDLCDYLRNMSHAYIFNASLPPAVCAGVMTAIEVMQQEPWRAQKLWSNTVRFRKGLISLGFDIMDSISPIIPVMIKDDMITYRLSKLLMERGVYSAVSVFPAVPKDMSRLRITMTASLSDDEIDRSLEILASCYEEVRRQS